MTNLKTDKVWYIAVEDKKEGPYSAHDLRNDFRVTPDTLVWREGFSNWVLLRFIPELQEIFQDDEESEDLSEKSSKIVSPDFTNPPKEEMVMALRYDPRPIWWGLFFVMLLLIVFYLFYGKPA